MSAPAPTFPSTTGASVAAFAARYPQSAVGRIFGSPTMRSNSDAPGTVGTYEPPKGKPLGGEALAEQWYVLVECRDDKQQVELLGRFKAEGLTCKAVLS